MGTRNLTLVHAGGEYRLSQYGQWDGYPEGQGATVLAFLRDAIEKRQLTVFLDKLLNLPRHTEEEVEKIWNDAGAVDGMIGMDDADKVKTKYPELSRDTAADILNMVQNGTVKKLPPCDIGFVSDSLFCEWAYVIDFDKNTFEVFKGFNQTPNGDDERFPSSKFLAIPEHRKDKPPEDQYHPVRLLVSFPLDSLPDDDAFFKACGRGDDEDEEEAEVA